MVLIAKYVKTKYGIHKIVSENIFDMLKKGSSTMHCYKADKGNRQIMNAERKKENRNENFKILARIIISRNKLIST